MREDLWSHMPRSLRDASLRRIEGSAQTTIVPMLKILHGVLMTKTATYVSFYREVRMRIGEF